MKAIAVIGAGFGDEGKGLTIDYLARAQAAKGQRPLIVRFNGGPQAGHTVQTASGKRHVFSHIGAGTFVPGARTYLSSQFIVNPYTLRKELVRLKAVHDEIPKIFVHPACSVTTVIDMAMNSLAELSRGDSRHGSCGMGINETVTRTSHGFGLKVSHVNRLSSEELALELKAIREVWVPRRLEQLGLVNGDMLKHEIYGDVLALQHLTDADFLSQAESLKQLLSPMIILDKAGLDELLATIEPDQEVLLEGAQGLALDEFLGAFPYVTRSVTGLPSALAVAAFELQVTELEPIYVTRAYTTRHGAGPLDFEGEAITDKQLYDMTNVENMWQGSLRLAPLNLGLLKTLIGADLARANKTAAYAKGVSIKQAQLMLTCLDQLGPNVAIVNTAGNLQTVATVELPLTIGREIGRDVIVTLCSYGPTASHVKSWI